MAAMGTVALRRCSNWRAGLSAKIACSVSGGARAEGSGQAEAPPPTLAQRRILHPAAARGAESRMELRLRGSAHARRAQLAAPDHDRRVYARMPSHPRGTAVEQCACDRGTRGVHVQHGVPDHVRSDNGAEMTARRVKQWLPTVGTRPMFIEPGSPWENGYCESFNGKRRDECLNGEIFYSLKEAQVVRPA